MIAFGIIVDIPVIGRAVLVSILIDKNHMNSDMLHSSTFIIHIEIKLSLLLIEYMFDHFI